MRFPVDGHDIDYEIRGEGRTLVLIHGLTFDRQILVESCEPVFAEAAGWRRIYVDLPGHGASTANREAMSADHLVAALAALIRETAGERPYLLGYSYGAYLAQGLVRVVPNLGGLFLAAPVVEPDFGKRRVPPPRIAARDKDLVLTEADQQFAGESVVHDAATLDAYRRVVHPAHEAVNREALGITRARYIMSTLVTPALAMFPGPVSIAAGHHDSWVGYEDALSLVRTLPLCRYSIMSRAGQLLPIEAPREFRKLLREWLEWCEGVA